MLVKGFLNHYSHSLNCSPTDLAPYSPINGALIMLVL